MLVERRIREAELAFLNAPFSEVGWNVAIRQLAIATGSQVAQLCGGGDGPGLAFNHFSQDLHDPHGHLLNPDLYGPENWRINCTQRARTIQHERHYAAYREANPPGFYDDAVSDLDLFFGCQTALLMDSNVMVGLALLRTSRDGPCSADTVSAFARVARQAHRAIRVQLALGREQGEEMLAGLASSKDMTLLLDGQGQVVAMTEAAERLFNDPAALRLDGLALRLPNPGEDRALRATMSRLLNGDDLYAPVLHEARAGRSAGCPDGCWRLFLTRLPLAAGPLEFGAAFALTLRPAT